MKRGLTAIEGIMLLMIMLLLVQMWLLASTLEAFLAGHREVALPGMLVSLVLFLCCAGMYAFVARLGAERK